MNKNIIEDKFSKDRSQIKQLADESYKVLSQLSELKEKMNVENVSDQSVKRFVMHANSKTSRLQLDVLSLVVFLGDASCSEVSAELELLMKESN